MFERDVKKNTFINCKFVEHCAVTHKWFGKITCRRDHVPSLLSFCGIENELWSNHEIPWIWSFVENSNLHTENDLDIVFQFRCCSIWYDRQHFTHVHSTKNINNTNCTGFFFAHWSWASSSVCCSFLLLHNSDWRRTDCRPMNMHFRNVMKKKNGKTNWIKIMLAMFLSTKRNQNQSRLMKKKWSHIVVIMNFPDVLGTIWTLFKDSCKMNCNNYPFCR